jgi:hypothetical protein
MSVKKKVYVTYTIKHKVEIYCDPKDRDFDIEIVGCTLAENGSCSYKDSDAREILQTEISFCATYNGCINQSP